MEGKSSSGGNLMPAGPYGFLDLQGSMQLHHQQSPHLFQQGGSAVHPQIQDVFSFRVQNVQEQDQPGSFAEYNKGERGKSPASDDDEANCAEDGADGNNEVGKAKRESPWQRVKWTDKMVKLLITAVSYIGEDAYYDGFGGGRRKSLLLQKKGKWKSVSNAMAERGFHVSPQQCEDKFNDLNKRYKKLNDVLGRGTSCKVVENPKLLDYMDLSEKAKEDVRKILSSKHLFYEEMCSYHNGNRLYLPHDPDLQRSLHLALRNKDDLHQKNEEFDEEDQDAEADEQDDETEDYGKLPEVSGKRLKLMDESEDVGVGNRFNFLDCNRRLGAQQNDSTDMELEHNSQEGSKADVLQKQWLTYRSLQLEEQKLHIKAQMLKLEKQRFKWQRISWKQDRELEAMRLENQHLKLENEHLALEIKSKELGAD